MVTEVFPQAMKNIIFMQMTGIPDGIEPMY